MKVMSLFQKKPPKCIIYGLHKLTLNKTTHLFRPLSKNTYHTEDVLILSNTGHTLRNTHTQCDNHFNYTKTL